MKTKYPLIALLLIISSTTIAAWQDAALNIGTDLVKAGTISDKEVLTLSSQYAVESDKTNKTLPADNPYSVRLNKLFSKHQNEDGLKLNYKVYDSKDINAFSLADGTVRVYTGLMDLMDDNELLGVIGHEIGHVKLGHTKSRMRTAYLSSAGKKGVQAGVASQVPALSLLTNDQVLALGEQAVNAQYSQQQERDADDYGLKFLKKHGYPQKALVSSMMKLSNSSPASGGINEFFASHPDSKKRAQRLQAQIK
jgi:putative metalloprotease